MLMNYGAVAGLIALGLAILFLRSALRVLTRASRELQLEQRPT